MSLLLYCLINKFDKTYLLPGGRRRGWGGKYRGRNLIDAFCLHHESATLTPTLSRLREREFLLLFWWLFHLLSATQYYIRLQDPLPDQGLIRIPKEWGARISPDPSLTMIPDTGLVLRWKIFAGVRAQCALEVESRTSFRSVHPPLCSRFGYTSIRSEEVMNLVRAYWNILATRAAMMLSFLPVYRYVIHENTVLLFTKYSVSSIGVNV